MNLFRSVLTSGGVIAVTAGIGIANPRLDCTPTSPMKDHVGEGGYGFSAHSNLGTYGDEMCLQHILRNIEGNTAAKVLWYEPTKNGNELIIGVPTLPGCYDALPSQKCNCKDIPCQIAYEFHYENFGVKPILSTAEFGIRVGQYSDSSVKARNVDVVGFLDGTGSSNAVLPSTPSDSSTQGDSLEDSDQVDTRYAIFNEGDNTYPPMTTRLSGYPAGPSGEVISLDMYFKSTAIKLDDEYVVENSISTEDGFKEFIVAPLENTRAGEINLKDGTAAVSWSGFEPKEFESIFFPQDQLLPLVQSDFHKYVANRVGVELNADIVIFMDGEIVLETQAPVYTGLE